jgi:hypothetical protein
LVCDSALLEGSEGGGVAGCPLVAIVAKQGNTQGKYMLLSVRSGDDEVQ